MLGIEKNPKLIEIKANNPLNNITVPTGGLGDLESRIDQFTVKKEEGILNPQMHLYT